MAMPEKNQKLILFIEDEEAFQKTFGEILSEEGYKIISAAEGVTGLDLAKKEKPDLILLDLILPKKDGFEVLRDLKADANTKNIPVIVLSVLESYEDIQKAIELGATSYLIKANYTPQEVVSKVKSALGLK